MAETILVETQLPAFTLHPTFQIYGAALSADYTLILGETYRVVWDDEEWECVGQDASAVLGVSGSVALGNCAAMVPGMIGNGEKFIIAWNSTGVMYASTVDTAAGGIHTVAIYTASEETGTIFSEQTFEGFGPDESYGGLYTCDINPAPFTLTLGETYDVSWDGETYRCQTQDLSSLVEGSLGLGNLSAFPSCTGNDEPFAVGWSQYGVTLLAFDTEASHTVAIYTAEEEATYAPTDIILKRYSGEERIFEGANVLHLRHASGEGTVPYSYGEAIENVPVTLDFSEGDQTITAPEGTLVKSAVICKPGDLAPENVRKGKNIAGIEGEFLGDTEEVVIGESENAIELDWTNGAQVILPSEETKSFSKVTLEKPSDLRPENIAKDKNVGGIIGTYEGGGSGETALAEHIMGGTSQIFNTEVEYVAAAALYGNPYIETANFPNCSYVASSAFRNCTGLKTVVLPECTEIGSQAFGACTQLTSISAPKVTQIENSAFASCYALSAVAFAECTSIGNYAFQNCSRMTSISFPACESVGAGGFSSCAAIEGTVSLPKCLNLQAYAFASCSKMSSIYLPVCSLVPAYAFMRCSALTNVYIPKCTTLASAAFYSCTNLTEVTIGGTTRPYVYSGTFSGTCNNKRLRVRGSASFQAYCFSGCLMSALEFSAAGTAGASLFRNCPNLRDVYITTTFNIWTHWFYNCSTLERLRCTRGFGSNALYGCSKLRMISTGYVSLISIGAFVGCSRLSVFCMSRYSAASIAATAFNNTPFTNSTYLGYYGSFYVPESQLTAFQTGVGWSAYSSRFTVITDEIEALFEGELP